MYIVNNMYHNFNHLVTKAIHGKIIIFTLLEIMSEIEIYNINDWNNNTSAKNNLKLCAQLTFTDETSFNMINLKKFTFDGNFNSITINGITNFTGLFQINGGTIKNLKVFGINNILLKDNCSYIVTGSTTKFGQSGTIQHCFSNGTINGVGCGGIAGARFSGTVDSCYNCGNITGEYCGGIAGQQCAWTQPNDDSLLVMQKCYNLGIVSGNYSGGLCGAYLGQTTSISSSCLINNCYSVGNLTGLYQGGLVGYRCCYYNSNIVTIKNSYFVGINTTNSSFNGGIVGSNSGLSGTLKIFNCVYNGNISGSSATISLNANNSNVVGNISGQIYNTNIASWTDDSSTFGTTWDSNIWKIVDQSYPILKTFIDTTIWDDTIYLFYNDCADYLTVGGCSIGDPHVKPIFGNWYTLPDEESTFLLLSSPDDKIQMKGSLWFLPHELFEHKLEKFILRTSKFYKIPKYQNALYQTTYFKYVQITCNKKSFIIDMDDLLFKTYDKDKLKTNTLETNNDMNIPNVKISKIRRSKFGLHTIQGDYLNKGKTIERIIEIDTLNEIVYIRLAKDRDNLIDRNSISVKISSNGKKYYGAFVREEYILTNFN